MTRTTIKKFTVAAGLAAFTLMLFGSLAYGARFSSSFIRGVEGFIVFGLLAWAFLRGWAAVQAEESLGGGEDKDKGANLDQTA